MNRILLPLATLLATMTASAQQDAAPTAQKPAEIKFRVLDQTQINLGDRKLILNRVAPPTLTEQRAVVAPPAIPLSAEAAQAAVRRESKKAQVLFLSATVYDRAVTQLRWFGEGGEFRVFSNIDFNYLTGLGAIETEDTVYTLFLGVGNETAVAGQDRPAATQIPPLSQFSPQRAEYFVVEDKARPASPETLAGIDALHRYYDANRAKLADDYEKREAARVEKESEIKAHPPVPRDTVINFWPADARQIQEMKTKEGQR